MALTMTRTRTQTALNKLVEMVANVHGELAFVEGLLAQAAEASMPSTDHAQALASRQELLQRRQAELLKIQDALYLTVRQFDPGLRPEDIGALQDWLKPFGRKPTRATMGRYLVGLGSGAA